MDGYAALLAHRKGDLNYRVTLPDREAKEMIKNDDLASLFAQDQLRIEQDAGRAFCGFKEPTISFSPTYKLVIGSRDTYETSDKKRTPSWCDRILYFQNPAREAGWLSVQSYDSVQELVSSDHKPIRAIMTAQASNLLFK